MKGGSNELENVGSIETTPQKKCVKDLSEQGTPLLYGIIYNIFYNMQGQQLKKPRFYSCNF